MGANVFRRGAAEIAAALADMSGEVAEIATIGVDRDVPLLLHAPYGAEYGRRGLRGPLITNRWMHRRALRPSDNTTVAFGETHPVYSV